VTAWWARVVGSAVSARGSNGWFEREVSVDSLEVLVKL